MEWFTIRTAPKDGRWILLWDDGRAIPAHWDANDERWETAAMGAPHYEIREPRYWIEIEPPGSASQ